MMSSKRWSALLITLVMSCVTLGVTQPDAFAKKKSSKPKVQQQKVDKIAAVLGDMKWGASDKDVVELIKKQRLDEMSKDQKLRKDPLLMQEARKQLVDQLSTIEKTKTELKGDRTGYEVSVIADEFTPNVGESMMVVRDKVAQRYYFFMHGRLYKLVIAYDKEYLKGVDFEPFAAQTAQRYGRPISTDYGDVFGEEELTSVTWEDDGSILAVHNKREFFGTFTMVFSDKQRVQELTKRGLSFGGKGKATKKQAEVSSEVAQLTRDGGEDPNKNIVDGMVGSVNIDLNEGRPEDDKLRPEDQESPGESSKTTKTTKDKTKKPKKPKTKKKPRRKFEDLNAGDNELVIY